MSRKRRFGAAFEWIPLHDDNNNNVLDIRLKHTDLQFHEAAPSTIRNYFVSAPASPAKIVAPTHNDPVYGDEHDSLPTLSDTDNVDPQYAHQLQELDMGSSTRRKRTAAVRI